MSKKFGEIAVEKGLITTKELETALEEQSKKRVAGENEETTLIGHLLLKTGSLDDSDLKSILKFQSTQRERYQYLETLGAGGMGVVQLVQDHLLGRQVALKQIQSRKGRATRLSAKQQMMIWRLEQEASITAILEHPNIVPLYDMQQKEDGELQFTMRKVEGDTFRSILRKKRSGDTSYDENKLLSIFFKICDAVAYAHSKGIIHRDLKPDNIMVGQFGEVYVMDWGIAKQCKLPLTKPAIEKNSPLREITKAELSLETENSTGEPEKTAVEATKTIEIEELYKTVGGMGTEGYMPPEQREDASTVTPQSDIYALGKILKECFTYLSPTEELQSLITPNAEQLKKGDTSSAKIDSIKNKLPKDIQALVEKATRTAPEERYASVQAFSKDVEKYQKNMLVSAKDYSLAEILSKWTRRNYKLLSLIISSLLIIASFIAYTTWIKHQKHSEYLQNAINEDKQANDLLKKGRNIREKKVNHLLESLAWLNKALLQLPSEKNAEEKKLEVAEKLLALCYEEKDYQLAHFVVKELENISISILTKEKKNHYIEEREEKKGSTLKEHQRDLDKWLDKFEKGTLKKGEQQDFVFEVSQMHEEEILKKLLELFEDGLKRKLKILNKIEAESDTKELLDRSVIEVLGRSGNTSLTSKLFEALKTIYTELLNLKSQPKEQPEAVIYYMSEIAVALTNLKDVESSQWIHQIWLDENIDQKLNVAFRNKIELVLLKIYEILLPEITKKIQDRPKDEEIYLLRAQINLELDKNLNLVLSDCNKSIEINPQNAKAYVLRGSAKEKLKQDHNLILEDLNKAIELAPQNFSFYQRRGEIYLRKKEFDFALQNFKKAIQLNPKSYHTYLLSADTKLKIKTPNEALEDANQALFLNDKYAKAWLARGTIKFEKDDIIGAIEDLDESIRLDPLALAYSNRGTIYHIKLSNSSKALLDFDQAIKLDPNLSQAYHGRGNVKFAQKDLDGAISDFNKALILSPDFSESYAARGCAKFEKKEYQNALEDFDKAIQLNSLDSNTFYNRGRAKFVLKKYNEAILDYDKALELEPNKAAKIYLSKGNIYKDLENFEEAIVCYNKAIELDPNMADAFLGRGEVNNALEHYEDAISDYSRTINLKPRFSQAYNSRGNSRVILKNYQEALSDYNKAIEVDPQCSEAYSNRGLLRVILKEYENALSDYNKAIELDSKNAKAYYGRGLLRVILKEYENALSDYNKAIELNPQNWEAYYNRGTLKHNSLKDYQNALSDYDKAIELNPQCSEAYFNRGILKQNFLKDYQNALSDYDKAIELNPQYSEAYSNRGALKHNFLKDYQNALSDYDKAIELNPQCSEAYLGRGALKHIFLKEYENALSDYDKAIELNPQCSEAYYGRGLTKVVLKEYENALSDYDKAIELNPQFKDAYFYRGKLKYELKLYEEAGKDFIKSILVEVASPDNSALQVINSPSNIHNLSAKSFDICVGMLYRLKKFQEAQDLLLLFKKELIPIFPQYSFSIEQTLKLIEKELKK